MRPESGVSVVKTSQLLWGRTSTDTQEAVRHEPERLLSGSGAYFAIVMRPTLFSGLLRVFE